MREILSVVGDSIMVGPEDLREGDFIFIGGTEGDPIVSKVTLDYISNTFKIYYLDRGPNKINETVWLSMKSGVFIHDLHREAANFKEKV